jgi:hypothetical protein
MVFSSQLLAITHGQAYTSKDVLLNRPTGERNEPDQEWQPNRPHHWHGFNNEKDRSPKTTNTAVYYLPHRHFQEWRVGQWQAEPLIRSVPILLIFVRHL